jgi:hypothetical protein
MKPQANQAHDRTDTSPRSNYFGRQLRALRETYVERTGRGSASGPMLRTRVSALALIQCLEQAGYPISSGAFSEIENGLSIPRDAPQFVESVCACLQVTKDDKQDLIDRLAYDVLYARLGELVEQVFPAKQTWKERR